MLGFDPTSSLSDREGFQKRVGYDSTYMMFEILNTKNVPPSDEDIRLVAEMHIHPEIRKWDMDYVHHSDVLEENIRGFTKFFKRLLRDENQLCLLAKLDGEVVGFLGIHRFNEPKRHVGDVGIMVHPDYQCKGMGTELLKAGIKLARKRYTSLKP